MVMFEKNGQGYFDFDYDALVALTSEKFASEVKETVQSKFTRAVEIAETVNFIIVQVIRSGVLHYFQFIKEDGKFHVNFVPIHVCEWAAKVGY